MNKKISIICTSNATPFLETSLEIAKGHLDKNDYVNFYFIGNSVDFAEFNFSSFYKRFFFRTPQEKGSIILQHPKFRFYEPSKAEIMLHSKGLTFDNIEDLIGFEYEAYKAGLSSFSSLVSFTSDTDPSLSKYQSLLLRIIDSGISVYEYSKKVLKTNAPDLLYLFNGRFAVNRAIMDAAKELDINFRIFERGADMSRYYLKPYMPHNVECVMKDLNVAWNQTNLSLEEKSKIAHSFFINRRNGVEQGWVSFVQDKVKGRGINLNKEKRIISYFSSSDDEYVAVGDVYKWDRWPNQLSAFQSLMNIVASDPDLYLVIRLHPNKKGKRELDNWLNLTLPSNAIMILADELVDTYWLIEQSDVVVSAGSTVGIEAVYWNRSSICLGPSLYSNLGAVYFPDDDFQLERLLKDNLAVDSSLALPYGYYMSTFGERFTYYEPDSLFSGRFCGQRLAYSGVYFNFIKAIANVARSLGVFN